MLERSLIRAPSFPLWESNLGANGFIQLTANARGTIYASTLLIEPPFQFAPAVKIILLKINPFHYYPLPSVIGR